MPVLQRSKTRAQPREPSADPERSGHRLSDRSVALAGLGRLALRSTDTSSLFNETVDLLALTLRVELTSVFQLLPGEERMLLVAGSGWKRDAVGHASVPAGRGSHAGFVLTSGSALVVRNFATDKRFRRPSLLSRLRVVSSVSVLIGTEQDPWGVLGVHAKERRNFCGRDAHFLQAVSHILSEAIKRQDAEAELRDSERRLRLVTNAMPALIAYFDRQLVYRYCNARYTEWFGLELAEIVGKRLPEVLGPAAFEMVQPAVRKALGGTRAVLESKLPYRYGPSRDVHAEYIPHIGANKEVLGFYSMVVDISERAQAESTRGWLAAIVEHSHDAIVGKTLNGVITSWNAAAERMYGYRPDEIVGQSVEMLFPPERKHEMRSILERVANGEAVNQEETIRLRKDGSPLNVLVTISPIRGERNQILGASSIAHDMTEYKRADLARRESEERLRLAKEAAELGIFDWNIDTGEIRWDARAAGLWGVDEKESPHYNQCSEAVVAEDRKHTRAALDHALDPAGEGRYRAEFRVTSRADQLNRWVAATGQVSFENGRPVRMVGTVQDISERKRVEAEKQEWAERLQRQLELTQKMEESLRRSNRDLEQFTAVVTHDLRNPLASALFTGELLRKTLEEGATEQNVKDLSQVLESLWQMDALIKELHSQALVRSPDASSQPVDLESVLASAEKRAALALEKTGGKVVKETPLPAIRGNPAMLAQLFSNLIENGIKYRRSEPPVIRVRVQSDDRHYAVIISDNGRGIPEEDRERVFVSRERGSNVGDTPGSGLGLALCYRIMQAHGGTISVTTSEDGGAAFELIFPRPNCASAAA